MSFNYSIYIPRVFKGITQEQIRGTFYGQSIGKVGRVDLLKVYNEKNNWVYNKAFVHFDEWFSTSQATDLKSAIESGKGNAKLDYETNRYWMLLPNASEKVPEEEQNNISDPTPMDQAAHPMMMPPNHPILQSSYEGFVPIIPPHIMANPYSYMQVPPDMQGRDRYYTNYTSAHHAYFNQYPPINGRLGAPQPYNGDQTPRPSLMRQNTIHENDIPRL